MHDRCADGACAYVGEEVENLEKRKRGFCIGIAALPCRLVELGTRYLVFDRNVFMGGGCRASLPSIASSMSIQRCRREHVKGLGYA